MIKIGSQFSGVGAFDMALKRLNIDFENVYQAEWDKYARQTYLLNNEAPTWYVHDVYDTPIDKIPQLDIAMFSPPCQSFSLAGKRQGENSDKGILFYASHEFIKVNNPRYFIFENVKGLLSDDGGKTFQRWIDYLGGKSVNGNPVLFPHENSTPYHVYYQVMNAKHYGVPQNRERIFIIGIRDDVDNTFSFPKPFHLIKRLKDVLESEVDEKYFLSDTMLTWIDKHREKRQSSGKYPFTEEDDTSGCITARYNKMGAEDIFIGTWRTHEDGRGFRATEDNNCPTIPARAREDGSGQPVIKIGAIRGRNPENPKSRQSGLETEQMLEINENGTSNALTTVQKDNVVVEMIKTQYGNHQQDCFYDSNGIIGTIPAGTHGNTAHFTQTLLPCRQRIRRLTPFECFRLMDFNQDMIERTINSKLISDSQLYKMAGNSICVGVLAAIIEKLKI